MVSAERASALRNKSLNLAKTRRSGSGPASERTSQSRQLMSANGRYCRKSEKVLRTFSLFLQYLPLADINCRDCDVRSLAGPEPDRRVFAKFKDLLRKADARSAETICVTIGEILRAFMPTECANCFRNSGYAQKHHSLVFVRLAHDRR